MVVASLYYLINKRIKNILNNSRSEADTNISMRYERILTDLL